MRWTRTNESQSAVRELSFTGFLLVAGMAFLFTWAAMWAYIAIFPMAYEGRDYPLALAKNILMSQCRANQIVVFGDSRAVAGVLPTVMNLPVENLAFPGASPVETYFLVKRVLHCPEPPRLVVIAHSASMYPQDKFFWSLFASLDILSTADVRSVEAEARALGDNELEHAERPKAVPFKLLPILYEVHFPPLYFGVLADGYVAARWRYNNRALNEAIRTSGRSSFGTADGSDAISDEAKMADWRVSPLVNLYLDRTLAMLAAHHVPVMIMTMPINASTCEHLPAVVQPRFSAYLEKIARANPNVELVDSTIPCWPDKFYGDAWHFNMTGTLAYSQKLQGVLVALLHENEVAAKSRDKAMITAMAGAKLQMPQELESPNE